MSADYSELREGALTERVIACCFDVHNELGHGFLETVYRNALVLAMRQGGLDVEVEVPFDVQFRGKIVGEYRADCLVGRKVIVEVKAVSTLLAAHEVQLVNYLKATGIEVGLPVNFGPKLVIRRKILSRSVPRSSA